VSVTMPTWANVVAYETGDPCVHAQLAVGYPRFKLHASVERLMALCLKRRVSAPCGHTSYSWTGAGSGAGTPLGHTSFSWSSDLSRSTLHCLVLPSRPVAERFKDYMVSSWPTLLMFIDCKHLVISSLHCHRLL